MKLFTSSAGKNEYRIIVTYDGKRRKLLKLRTGTDGSLHVFMEQQATKRAVWTSLSPKVRYARPKTKPFKISYHCTGQINFHEVDANTSFWEPIYALTGPFPLTYLSVPSVAWLPLCTDDRSTDLVVDWPPEAPSRVTFALEIAPVSYLPEDLFARVPFFKVYVFSMRFAALPIRVPDEFTENYFIRVIPFCGSAEAQVKKPDAIAAFKRRVTEAAGV